MAEYKIKVVATDCGTYTSDVNGHPLDTPEKAQELAEAIAEEMYERLLGRVNVDIEVVEEIK